MMMNSKKSEVDTPRGTPVYCLEDFGKSTNEPPFYIEILSTHLKKHEFISKPHRHDFYLILYIEKGGGSHIIDFVRYPILPGSFFVMTPGQVHSWQLNSNTEGIILFFTRDFYQMQRAETTLVDFSFFHSLNPNPLSNPKDLTLPQLLNDMLAESQHTDVFSFRILRASLEVLLLKLARCYPKPANLNASSEPLKMRKLEELIEKNFIKRKQPRDYAELMNLSASYLNTLCKQNLQKTLGELIQERVILEIKRLLSYTDLNVNQIADRLYFTSASYLIRYFRKHTGTTPDEFKESINGAI